MPRAIVVAIRTAKARPVNSRMPPIALVIARLRHNGPTSELSAIPAATVQPVSEDRAYEVISDTPSSDTVCRVASGLRSISPYSDGDARLPMVSCGLGIRAKLTPLPSKREIVQSSLGRCFSMIVWKIEIGGLKEMS